MTTARTGRVESHGRRLLPRGRLVMIPGVMHTISFYQPLDLTRVVRPFLNETTEAAA